MARRLLLIVLSLLLALSIGGCPPPQEAKPDEGPDKAKPAKTAGKSELIGSWEQDVKTKLEALIAENGKGGAKHDPAKPPVVVFDFDNTCIRGDIGRAFFDWMTTNLKFKFTEQIWQALPDDKRAGIKEAWQTVENLPAADRAASTQLQEFRKRMHQAYWSLCHETDADKCFPWQVRFYAGYTPDEVRTMAAQVFKFELGRKLGSEPIRAGADDPKPAITSTGLRIYKEMHQLMQVLEAKGFEIWVVTAGPQWVVQGAAEHFPVERDRMIGMRTKLADGKLTAEMEPPPTFRQGKVTAIEKFIGRKPVLVLGDSWTDAEMLSYAEHAILIDRGYADLQKKAFDLSWWVQPNFPVE
jgi:phosphoserine phosphatase